MIRRPIVGRFFGDVLRVFVIWFRHPSQDWHTQQGGTFHFHTSLVTSLFLHFYAAHCHLRQDTLKTRSFIQSGRALHGAINLFVNMVVLKKLNLSIFTDFFPTVSIRRPFKPKIVDRPKKGRNCWMSKNLRKIPGERTLRRARGGPPRHPERSDSVNDDEDGRLNLSGLTTQWIFFSLKIVSWICRSFCYQTCIYLYCRFKHYGLFVIVGSWCCYRSLAFLMFHFVMSF